MFTALLAFFTNTLIKQSFLILFLFIGLSRGYAQPDSLSRYFDDKEISTSKNILKLDLISVIRGDLGLQLEHKISNELSLTAGVGVLMPYYIHDLLISTGNQDINSKGFSYQLHSRWYPEGVPTQNHYGVLFRSRNFADVRTSEYALFLGKQKLPHKNFLYDWYFAIGIKTQKSKDGETYLYDSDFGVFPIALIGLQIGTLL